MFCKVPVFSVRIKYNYRYYNLKVEQISLDENREQFKIGSDRKHMVIETNRPFWRRKGLKHRKPTIWQITTGKYQGSTMDDLLKTVIDTADSLTTY